jgi:hypothetical protein
MMLRYKLIDNFTSVSYRCYITHTSRELNNEVHQPVKNRITKCRHSVIIATRSLPFVHDLRNVPFICITSVRNIFRPETYFAKYNTDACKMKKQVFV